MQESKLISEFYSCYYISNSVIDNEDLKFDILKWLLPVKICEKTQTNNILTLRLLPSETLVI